MKYIATYKTSAQISPDDFAVFNPTLELSDDTTIGEIKRWHESRERNTQMEVTIIEVEQVCEAQKG